MQKGWDIESDSAVVGFGGAGAAAAIRAAQPGASVLLPEKQSRTVHTPNTRMSGGLIVLDGAIRLAPT